MAGWYEGIQPPGLEASAHPDPLTHPHETQAVWHRESSPGWGQDAQLLRLAVLPGPWVTLGQHSFQGGAQLLKHRGQLRGDMG